MVKDSSPAIATLTITRFSGWAIPFAILAMALFRLPLMFNKKLRFWRLMGSGKNGTFDRVPDLNQWAIIGVFDANAESELKDCENHAQLLKIAYGSFITRWLNFFSEQSHTYLLQPIEGHGLWNNRSVFGILPKNSDYEGPIAIMTRATIRFAKLRRFWQHVPDAAIEMAKADGFIKSYGVGEWPWIKQATFSIWESKEHMRQFAYRSKYHMEIIRKTHAENWYSEDMFVRFRIVRNFDGNFKPLP